MPKTVNNMDERTERKIFGEDGCMDGYVKRWMGGCGREMDDGEGSTPMEFSTEGCRGFKIF